MLCKKPYLAGGIPRGCGQCLHCRINRRRVWTHRMMLEALKHGDSCFVTLTYSPEHLPHGGTLVPDHARDWLKRLRQAVPFKLRYYLVGEYGDKSQRPHYHAAVFGLAVPVAIRVVPRTWEFGLSYVGPDAVNSHIAQYVGGYVTKKLTKHSDPRLEGRHPEFARMSLKPGLGAWAMSDVAALVARYPEQFNGDVPTSLMHGGKSYPLGPYLTRKLRVLLGRSEKAPAQVQLRQALEVQSLYPVSELAGSSVPYAQNVSNKNEQRRLNREAKMKIFSQGRTL